MVGVNYAPEPSGIAPYTTGLCRGLVERGHHVGVLTSYPHYPSWTPPASRPRVQLQEDHGVEVVRLRHYVPERPSNARRLAFEVHFGLRALTRTWGRPDVVLSVSPALLSSALVHLRAGRGRARPATGVVVQDLYALGLAETGAGGARAAAAFRAVEGHLLRSVTGVAAIHDRFRDRIVDDLGVAPEAVRVIRNWTHVQPAEPFDVAQFRADRGWRPEETVVLHAGAMGAKQGLTNVVEAARLADVRGLPLRFVLLGDGGQRPNLQAAAVGLSTIDFVPPLNDKDFARTLAAADVLLVNERPELREMAVPSKLTSYFSSRTPVIAATDIRSTTASEVQAARAGEVVPPGDPEALVAKALEVRAGPSRWRQMGERGPDYVKRVLARDTAVSAYDEWVRELFDRRERRSGESRA